LGRREVGPAGRRQSDCAPGDPQDRFEFDGYERLEADMKREFGDCAWWFDTAALTPEETAEQLVAGAADCAPPLQPGWNAWLRQLHQVQSSRPTS
jgi:hypothetical protein